MQKEPNYLEVSTPPMSSPNRSSQQPEGKEGSATSEHPTSAEAGRNHYGHLHHYHHDDDNGDDDFDDFHFTHLVVASLLALVILLIKGLVVAELYNFIAPRIGGPRARKIKWTTAVAIAIVSDILF